MEIIETSQGQNQIKDSRGLIDASVRTQYAEIEALKLKNEKQQKLTRNEEEKRRQERYNQILQEANDSSQRNQALEIKWSELKQYEECEELYKQIMEQNSIFKDIMNGKDGLITEFWNELKKKDDDYVKMLNSQSDDIKNMIEQMRKQFFQIRDENYTELDKIEEQFNIDRSTLLKSFEDNLKEKFSKHEKQILNSFTEAIKQEDSYFQQIENNRIKESKDYAIKKITLENEIQNLEKCLEDMKALYTLNTEKLDYNLKVLKEKHEENQTLQEELKKKEMQLNNRLRQCTKKYIEKDKHYRTKNKKLTQEYKRITKQFKELQRKFKHFEKADSDKYKEIMKMNEEEVRKLKDKIIKCDVRIHEQQLGNEWVPIQEEEDDKNQQKQNRKQNGELIQENEDEELEDEEEQLKISEERVSEICKLLIVEADFLIDDRMREQIEQIPEDQEITQRLDTIKKCLGIESVDEMNMFFEDLILECRERTIEELFPQQEDDKKKEEEKLQEKSKKRNKEDFKTKEQEEKEKIEQQEENQELNLETIKIDTNQIIEFLINWIQTREERKKRLEMISNKKIQKVESEREKKEKIAREGKKYWEKLTHVLPERTFRIWKVLDKSLSKYYQLLQNRQKLIYETGELHNQNEQLKHLMNQYLQINHELIIPPTRVINIDPNN
ncbi:hypothetical protein PPERSA_04753 [Pseudocohnilembus persalinus]|uniref:Dynein regulatory complex protein 1 C-terminal domain-containing protein n=1 Tax=Pseudocohnilembus persalinus TaxID=266149 RepID=A0A0V0QNE5_PSEPJ|nr:hypothetical protein PPERSA_04753 [Pseudocohnilembus persalinus]|eukprot:KRX03875.1 hypothetical protein PPERSA_04753 [Pseudocohnilembus persalinus]